MPHFSQTSLDRLKTCDERLQRLFNAVIQHYDCSILSGYRSNEEQDKLYQQGKSRCKGGQSKHNHSPSLAVDVAPYPVDWTATRGCRRELFLLTKSKKPFVLPNEPRVMNKGADLTT